MICSLLNLRGRFTEREMFFICWFSSQTARVGAVWSQELFAGLPQGGRSPRTWFRIVQFHHSGPGGSLSWWVQKEEPWHVRQKHRELEHKVADCFRDLPSEGTPLPHHQLSETPPRSPSHTGSTFNPSMLSRKTSGFGHLPETWGERSCWIYTSQLGRGSSGRKTHSLFQKTPP